MTIEDILAINFNVEPIKETIKEIKIAIEKTGRITLFQEKIINAICKWVNEEEMYRKLMHKYCKEKP